ncbi:Gfo/Idh/MocA family protein [Microbacterium oleivorans]|uniref:Gfo/Idh/MocA family protein n=1 Tax=Microbacterium oleivorans TaxID=273677 RepID=UPI00203BC294|nr:Gfo/Idh/MocA family oxidoreductase [Microbacterium oleivorans]MCM3695333.1 Gfo/Idh/MocA family oxidoreductase [Microbacterium oleivorans]
MGSPHAVGIVGLGVISRQYLDLFATSPSIRVAAVADLNAERAADVAAALPDARALTVAELMADQDVQTVLNLTVPAAHAEVAHAAVSAGKSVHGEKPLALTVTEGRGILEAATAAGVRVTSAPDTVLGTGIQTARRLVDDGAIGTPMSASATWVSPGHELWHPAPGFYYAPGGGPLFDMGPYYLTSLVHLLGPIVAVTGAARRARSQRTIATGPHAGEQIEVEVDTHVSGLLEHAGGAVSTIVTSFDAVASTSPPIEVHGDRGSLIVPDPNMFDGEVRLAELGRGGWRSVAASAGYADSGRGIGLIDAVAGQGPGRAGGSLALHVLDVMESLLRSSAEGRRLSIHTVAERPPLVPLTAASEWSRSLT